ncbi:MAG: hypothetical protein GW911_04175 [Armatimonadetes bacterium]|nr:hypothetical protein [Armatimonadota bacterium]NDK11237.1 hypothetical protein [Armatimonadota bacterium]
MKATPLIALLMACCVGTALPRASAEEQAAPAAAAAPEAPAAAAPVVPAAPAPEGPRPEDEPGRVQQRGDETLIDMSFDKADLVTVLRMLGRLAKATIAIDAELTGQVTIASTGRIPLREAFEIVNSVLQVKGYTMVGRLGDGVIKVLPEKEAATSGVTVATGKRAEDIPEHDTFLTQIVPVEFIDAQRIAQELKPLVAADTGSLVASSSTNHLIITDTASNVKRIVSIVSELDKDQANVLSVEVIKLQYADAQSTATLLTQLFEQPRTGQVRLDPNQRGGGSPPGVPPGVPGRASPTVPGLMQAKEEFKIQADQRTNSIIASASKERIEQIQQIVKAIDVNLEPDVRVQVFELKFADASTVAQEINQILEQPQGGATSSRFQFPWSRSYDSGRNQTRVQGLTGLKENIIVPDVRNNALVATGTPENLLQVGELVAKLDVNAPLTDMMRIYPLENANAEDVENTLERAFGGQNRSRGFFSFLFGRSSGQSGAALDILQDISVESDEATNSLVVTAPPQAHTLVEEMVRQLDKPKQQVFIEVAIVDVTLDNTTRLGVEWSWKTEGQPQDTIGTDFQIKNSQDFAEGMRYTVVGKELNAVLDALMEKHDVRVLSTPHVTTTDNVRATVEIGTRYPYVKSISQNATGQIPVFDWYDITVNLQVTPRIKTSLGADDDDAGENKRADRYIQMQIQQSLAELQGQVQQLGFTSPIVGSRTANTTVSVADGQTIVIGGMIRESTNKVHKKVPFLGDLPIVGSLFRSTDDKVSNTELLVFLTPHVLKNDRDIQALTDQARTRTSTLGKHGTLTDADVKVGNAVAGTDATLPTPAPQPQPAKPAGE